MRLGPEPVRLSPTFIPPTALPRRVMQLPRGAQPFLEPFFLWEAPQEPPSKCHHPPKAFLQKPPSWKSPVSLALGVGCVLVVLGPSLPPVNPQQLRLARPLSMFSAGLWEG